VFISASQEHERAFLQMAGSINQPIISVRDVRSAEAVIEEYRPQVVVCDTDTRDVGSWRDLLQPGVGLPDFKLIVVSRHADDALWAEVLNLGGFDVLPIPVRREEIERVMRSALCRQPSI